MRVQDWHRWQMTKLALAMICLLAGIACAGGLEDADGLAPMPSPLGVVVALSCATALLYNIIQHDRRGKR